MYIHPGNEHAVREDDIIGVFDMDNTTVARASRGFLARVQEENSVINATEDIPRSYVVAYCGGKERVYLSSISTATMTKITAYKSRKD
jgi:hypothetical protein